MDDYISSLTGIQMDNALIDMAEHNSEAWAVGERNGIPVGSDDVTYQNNAQHYAQQAQSIAPASVTEAVRWDIAQTALTDSNKEQARANIDAGKNGAWSNPNLLDNAYFVGGGSQLGDGIFPINQRGTTFYSLPYGNIFDRWHIQGSATATCTLNANGISFAANTENCGLSQTIPAGRIVDGKPYTLSVMDTAGNIYSGSRVLNTNGSWQNFDLGLSAFGWYNPCYVAANGQTSVYILDRTGSGGSASIGIAAAKLELGTVSTLANDPPPDFGEELRKCQRYLFIHDYAQNDVIMNGITNNLTMFLPVSMRSGGSPTMTFTTTPYLIGNGVISTPTSVSLVSVNGNQVQIYAPTTESHNEQAIVLYAGSATRMTIANEL